MNERLRLYHGTSEQGANALLSNGWAPNSAPAGGHQGNPGLLYLTNMAANALWYAQEKGSDCVLVVDVDREALIVDPEDGIHDTVEAEIAGSGPANLALRLPIPADAFSRWVPEPGFTI